MIDLTSIFSALITLICALISAFLIPYIKTKVSAEKFETIKSWVKVAVQAAEMLYRETGMGEQKKAYVIEYLNSKGYKLDTDTLNNLIESAVLELNKQ
jgi:hypothetical protein